MHRKRLMVVSERDALDGKVRSALSAVDASIHSVAPENLLAALDEGIDLVVFDAVGDGAQALEALEARLAEEGSIPLLAVVGTGDLAGLRIPIRFPADFIVEPFEEDELVARIKHLAWPGEEASSGDFVASDGLSVNLATYQVHADGVPVDLTYLEYALLAFLVTHPGRTYSRDALLRRVWGFEYYGGSRTVDVHVRRIRAKLGPEAQRLETVRGVGYLWNA